MMNHRIVGIISFVFVAFSPLTVDAGLILSVDYEDGTFGNVSKVSSGRQTNTGYPSLCCSHSAQLVTSPVRNGNKAVKIQLRPSDEGYAYGNYYDPYVRAEFEKWNVGHVGDARWYGFSVYIDPSYADTSDDPNGTIILQLHGNKDACDIAKGPHLAIIITNTMQWRIRNQSDPNPCTTNGAVGRIDWHPGTATKGVWVDWVIYAKWSYGSDGELKIWKDGNLVVNRNGPNTYNDQDLEDIKWGIYKSWWGIKPAPASDLLTVYHDQIKVGDANSSFDEVAAKNSQPTMPAAPTNLQVKLP
jgi:hypothetical protein